MTNPSKQAIADYYDGTTRKALANYVDGNSRLASAIELAISAAPTSTSKLKILDIGCGIGISSAEFSRSIPFSYVHAVDISPKHIEIGSRLFKRPNLFFQVHDLKNAPERAPYDLITLLDVYEHIPEHFRPSFNEVLRQSLTSNGVIVLTIPSPFHQDYLARHKPQALQVVDETVTLDNLIELADCTRCKLVHFSYQSIWNTYDYCHAILARNPEYSPVLQRREKRIVSMVRPPVRWPRKTFRRLQLRRELYGRN